MSEDQRQYAAAQARFGDGIRLEKKTWYLDGAKTYVTMCYAFRNDVIVGIGNSWEDLLA